MAYRIEWDMLAKVVALEVEQSANTLRLQESTVDDVETFVAQVVDKAVEAHECVQLIVQADTRDEETGGALSAFVECFGMGLDTGGELEETLRAFECSYLEGVTDLETYAYDYAEEVLGWREDQMMYFAADDFARDLLLGGDVSENDGFYFLSNW